MKLWSRVKSARRNLFGKQRVEKQLDEEVRAVVDLMADERMAAGMTAEEARREALMEMGGIEQAKQAVRDRRAGTGLELLWQDVRFGWRQLLRNPGFTATALVTLSLSIGANTAIFSIVNALILKSLPYAHPERMGTIYQRITGAGASDQQMALDGEAWELLRDNVPALISAVGGGTSGVNLQAGARVQFVHAGRISAHYLDVLAITPAAGRNFSEAEDRSDGPKSAILSYALWHDTFGGDPNLLGQTIHLKGEPYTVIGVLPQGAHTPTDADVYIALQPSRKGEGMGSNFDVITRLRDGATWQQADAEINRAWAARYQRFVSRNPGARMEFYSVPLQKGQTAELRPKALTLMLAAGLILLIACANLAGLTLVRMVRRTPEVAMRLALGATRWQMVRDHVLPTALPGILTGTILGLSRAVGETAPVLMVGAAGAIRVIPKGPFDRYSALPVEIYNYAKEPDQRFQVVAAGGILILVAILLVMNAAAIMIRNRFKRFH